MGMVSKLVSAVADFKSFNFAQTIFHNLAEIKGIEPVKDGYGEGSFVVARALK